MKERPTNIVCNYSTQQFPVSMQFKIFVYCVNFQQYQKKKKMTKRMIFTKYWGKKKIISFHDTFSLLSPILNNISFK